MINYGINNINNRQDWRKEADPKYGLPSEIWYEVIQRRDYYNNIKHEIQNRNDLKIQDIITYNLKISSSTL